MTLYFFNDADDVEIDAKINNYFIIVILKSEPIGKLRNRILGSHLLISSLPDLISRTHVESHSKPRNSTSILEAMPGKLDIKKQKPSILYIHVYV